MIESLLSYGLWMGVVFIIIGFIALVKGADWLVDGASAIAKRFGISDLVIGLTVVAFGVCGEYGIRGAWFHRVSAHKHPGLEYHQYFRHPRAHRACLSLGFAETHP